MPIERAHAERSIGHRLLGESIARRESRALTVAEPHPSKPIR
jgi:hypothetical protein